MKRALMDMAGRGADLVIAALVLLTPLAFGSVEGWAIVALETSILVAGALWLVARAAGRTRRPVTGIEVPVLLFLVVVAVQLAPWPRSVVRWVSPHLSSVYEQAIPGYGHGHSNDLESWLLENDAGPARTAPGEAASGGSALPLTYSRGDTVDHTVLFVAYALLFLIVADRFRDRGRFRRLTIWIVFVGMGIALIGIFQKLSWNGKVLWFRNPPSSERPFGPFINPNHFAGYMELIVPLALGLFLTLLSRRARFGYRMEHDDDIDSRELERRLGPLAAGLEGPRSGLPWTAVQTGPKSVLLGFLIVLSIGSIVLSLSRGGFIATLIAFSLFARAIVPPVLRSRIKPGAMTAIVAGGAIALSIGFWLGASKIAERAASPDAVKSESSYHHRAKVWSRTVDLFEDHAALGTGFGTYMTAFAAYSPPGAYEIWKEAHNEYLQLLAEVGLVGFLTALLALWIFGRKHFLPVVMNRNSPDRLLTLGLAMGIVSLFLHSFVDFNLQIPAVGFLFVVVAGLLVARSLGPEAEAPAPRRPLLATGAVLLAAAALVSGVLGTRRAMSEHLVRRASRTDDPRGALALLERAAFLTPGRRAAASALGDRALEIFDDETLGPPGGAQGEALLGKAESAYRRVIAMDPLTGWGWWGLGEIYARRSLLERLEKGIDLSNLPTKEEDLDRPARLSLAALRLAASLDTANYKIHEEIAAVYEKAGLQPQAIEAYRTSARIMPQYALHDWPPVTALTEDVYRAIARGMDEACGLQGVADPVDVQKELGEMAYLRGDLAEAERRYRLGLAGASSRIVIEVLTSRLGEVLRQEGKIAEAVPLLERTRESRIVGWSAWLSLGQIRASQGDRAGAIDAFSRAHAMAPDAEWPLHLLASELAEAGDRARATRVLKEHLQTHPGSADVRELLIQLLRDDARLDEAAVEADALAASEPSHPEYRRLAGEIRAQMETGGAAR